MTALRVIAFGLAVGFYGHFPNAFACGINWTIPENHFDSVNERGMVSLWETLDTVDFGNDLKLPLIVHFRSDRKSASPYLGDGWLFPLLESHVVQLDERHYVMVQPDGRNRYFFRKNSADTTLKDSGGWIAKIDDNRFTAWADCGWKLEFAAGKIMAITTPKNRRLIYTYVDGKVADIRESGGPVLSVTSPSEISYNSKRLNLALDERPRPAQIGGQNVISQLTTSFHHSDEGAHKSKTYAFGVTEALQPKVTIDGKRTITWDVQTGLVTSDGDWKYNISFLKDGSPNARPTSTSSRAIVERVNPAGTKESFFDDKLKGRKSILSLDGTTTVTSYFTSGPLEGKFRQLETIVEGQSKIVERATYDERGRPARWLQKDGAEQVYTYAKDGGYTKTTTRPDGAWDTILMDAGGKLTKQMFSTGRTRIFTYDGAKKVVEETDKKGILTFRDEYEGGLLRKKTIHGVRSETYEYLPGTNTISSTKWSTGRTYKYLFDQKNKRIGYTLNGRVLWRRFTDLQGTSAPVIVRYNRRSEPVEAKDAMTNAVIPLENLIKENSKILSANTTLQSAKKALPGAENL